MAQILLVEPEHPKMWGRYNQYHGLLKIGAWHKRRKDAVSYQVGCKRAGLPKNVDTIYVSSLFSYWEPYYLKSLAFYRKRYPNARLVFGGIHAINAYERVKRWEDTMGIHVQPFFPEAVDEIPDITLIGSRFASLLTSRGCPNNCTYCSSRNVYGHGLETKAHRCRNRGDSRSGWAGGGRRKSPFMTTASCTKPKPTPFRCWNESCDCSQRSGSTPSAFLFRQDFKPATLRKRSLD